MLVLTKVNKLGYALLEIMLAFGVAAVVITGMVSLGVSTTRAVVNNRAYSEAGKIAQREVDRLRVLRNISASWSAFVTAVSGCTTKCTINASGSPFTVTAGENIEGSGNNAIHYYFSANSPAPGDRVNYTVYTKWAVGNTPERTYKIEGVLASWGEL